MSPSFLQGKVRAKKVVDFSDIPSLGEWAGMEKESSCQDLNPSHWGQQHENKARVSSTCEGARLRNEANDQFIPTQGPHSQGTAGLNSPLKCLSQESKTWRGAEVPGSSKHKEHGQDR